MAKRISLDRSVYELTQEYPEIIDIMASLGFTDITKKVIRFSVGKMITIPKGASMRGISLDSIIEALRANGFEIEGHKLSPVAPPQETVAVESTSRVEMIKDYLRRLSAGESLDSVRADFVKNFSDVEAAEIMQAEQSLMAEGTPLREVQQLCDVHSALFHGATREERIANAELEVEASLERQQQALHATAEENTNNASELIAIEGHPLQTFTRENDALSDIIYNVEEKLSAGEDITELLPRVREIAIHYAKKGDLLYPHLKTKYDISGPSTVMWTVDDEIRDELGKLIKSDAHSEEWMKRASAVVQRAKEMIYKEQNILFPICAANFTPDEWKQIYRDAKDYAICLGVTPNTWTDAEKTEETTPTITDEIVMPGGHLTVNQLTHMLNTIPLEITFVDEDNINRYFNEGPKVFKRPAMAIDREVFSCHPPKIEVMVRAIIDDFRSGKRDSLPIWMEKNGTTMLVTYMAVRDKVGNYVGTMEIVQDMEFAKEHFLQKN